MYQQNKKGEQSDSSIKKNQIEILEIKNIIDEIKKAMESIITD